MKVLHLLATGELGGIETLIRNYDEYSVHDNIYVFVWSGGVVADSLKNRGRDTRILGKSNKQFFSVVRTVLEICKEEQVQIAVVHHESPLLKLLLLVCKFLKPSFPMVAYAHADAMVLCNENKPKGFALRKLIQKKGFGAADGTIAISKSVADSLLRVLNVPKKQIRIIYNGIPVKRFCVEGLQKERDENTLTATYVGRLSPEKGVDQILTLFAQLEPQLLKRIHLQIVGDGPSAEALKQLAEQKNLSSQISFLGSREDVDRILADSDLFVHFPRCKEGFGIAVIEAMAAGNICICLAKGALPEIIHHGEDGFLLQEISADEFSEILRNIIENNGAETMTMLRKKAQKRAAEFSVEQFSEQLDQYLKEIYDKKSKH